MRIVLQRVRSARVRVAGQTVGHIGPGIVLLVGLGKGDGPRAVDELAHRVPRLRIFPDEAGKMNRSLLEVGGEVLAVSQFTLYGDARRGRRPSFERAAPPGQAEPLFERFVDKLKEGNLRVQTGRFGAQMELELVNDGPVTLTLEFPPP